MKIISFISSQIHAWTAEFAPMGWTISRASAYWDIPVGIANTTSTSALPRRVSTVRPATIMSIRMRASVLSDSVDWTARPTTTIARAGQFKLFASFLLSVDRGSGLEKWSPLWIVPKYGWGAVLDK